MLLLTHGKATAKNVAYSSGSLYTILTCHDPGISYERPLRQRR
jgi:hypothetical protein